MVRIASRQESLKKLDPPFQVGRGGGLKLRLKDGGVTGHFPSVDGLIQAVGEYFWPITLKVEL